MTQEEFNRLPLLLDPQDMRDITGLDKNGLKALRDENPQIVARQCGQGGRKRGKFQYRKPEVAKLVGFGI